MLLTSKSRSKADCSIVSTDKSRLSLTMIVQSMFVNLDGALNLSLYFMTGSIASSFHSARFWKYGDNCLMLVLVLVWFSKGIVKYFNPIFKYLNNSVFIFKATISVTITKYTNIPCLLKWAVAIKQQVVHSQGHPY